MRQRGGAAFEYLPPMYLKSGASAAVCFCFYSLFTIISIVYKIRIFIIIPAYLLSDALYLLDALDGTEPLDEHFETVHVVNHHDKVSTEESVAGVDVDAA